MKALHRSIKQGTGFDVFGFINCSVPFQMLFLLFIIFSRDTKPLQNSIHNVILYRLCGEEWQDEKWRIKTNHGLCRQTVALLKQKFTCQRFFVNMKGHFL